MKFHGFLRSGTSHRLRIALHLEGRACEQVAVDLRAAPAVQPDAA